ncbi:MAG: POTRA domain-containing protein [Thermoanaerobaculia bacterium]
MIAGLLALALSAAPPAVPPADAASPPVVRSVSYDSDGPDDPTVAKLIEVRAGEALDPDAVRRTIQNLSATERYSQIAVEQEPAEGGQVALTVHLFRAYRVGRIRFAGNPVSAEELRRSLGFAIGDPYGAAEMEEGVGRLKRLLGTEGFSEAEVAASAALDKTDFEAEITYRIRSGPTTRLTAPLFDGDLAPFSADVFLRKMHWRTGTRYREEKARKSAQALQAYLLSQGRLKAEVRQIGVETRNHLAAPVFRVDVGPLVVLETRGVEEKRVRKDFLNLLKDQVFQEDLLIQYVDSLRRKYQESGYRKATVDYSIEETPGKEVVVLTVSRGAREWLEAVRVDGLRAFPEKTLRRLLLTRPRSLLHRGYLVDAVLEEDRAAVVGFYRSHGYTEVAVSPPQVAPGKKAGALRLTLHVIEGIPTKVRQVRLDGVTHTDPADVQKLLRVRADRPYDDQQVDDDRASLVNYYRDRGWTHAAVEPRVDFSPDRSEASVTYLVTEGAREFFGKTIVRGNTRTRTSRVEFPIRWREGDPLSETKMLDAQRELSRTGVFQKVEIRPAMPDPTTPERNVLVDITEARPLSLLYGLGYQYDDTTGDQSPFFILGAGYNNLFGSLRSISLESRFAPLTKRGRVLLNYRDPFLFGFDLPLTATVFYAREPISNIDIRRRGAFLEGNKQVLPRVRLGARLEFQRINVGSQSPLDLEKIQPFDRNISETTLGVNVLYDNRDEIIDPHRGVFVSSFLKYAFPVASLSADAKYLKGYAQVSAYQRALGGVLAVSVRAGAIHVPGRCSPGPSALACIPIAERFFSGGRTSNRGFDTNLAGVPGQSVDYSVIEQASVQPGKGSCSFDRNFNCDSGPRLVGGAATAGWNAEWRFPIVGDFGGTLFYDATQVWIDDRVRWGVEGADGLRQSVGIGLRFLTPVGPIRLEYGRVLHPRSFDVPLFLFDSDTGTIADTGKTVRRTEPKSQIFVSIGYPF